MAATSTDLTLAKAINRLADVHEKQLAAIAEALQDVGVHLKSLGNGDASTQLGGLEGVAISIKEAAEILASVLRREPDDG